MADHNESAQVGKHRQLPSLLLGASIALLAGVGAYWVGTNAQRGVASWEKLSVDPAELNFGEVWEDKGFAWTLSIHNRGDSDVAIADFEAACGCVVAVEPKSVVVPARGESSVRLTIDLTKQSSQGEEKNGDAFVREVEIPIAPAFENAAVQRLVWVLRGRVRTGVTVTPSVVHLGEITRGQPDLPKRVTVTPRTAIERLDVKCDSALASCDVRQPGEKGGPFYVEITPRDNLAAGDIRFEVAIQPVARGSERLPPVILPVQGVMREDVQAAPSAVMFGMVRAGQTVEETIVLRSVSGRKFTVKSAEAISKESELVPIRAVDGSAEYRLRQAVKGMGSQARKAVFTVLELSSGKIVKVEVPVSYYGMK
jgi:hypothetical protein